MKLCTTRKLLCSGNVRSCDFIRTYPITRLAVRLCNWSLQWMPFSVTLFSLYLSFHTGTKAAQPQWAMTR
eukprot:1159762-Pelagomonas_calceolata.AAC.6